MTIVVIATSCKQSVKQACAYGEEPMVEERGKKRNLSQQRMASSSSRLTLWPLSLWICSVMYKTRREPRLGKDLRLRRTYKNREAAKTQYQAGLQARAFSPRQDESAFQEDSLFPLHMKAMGFFTKNAFVGQ